MEWLHKSDLEELKASDLYQILKLRQDIFIIEQDCIYSDIDNLDLYSEHIFLKKKKKVIAYSRIVPKGKKYKHPSIGRIIVKKEYRGNGLGKEIVKRCLNILSERGTDIVIIEAQHHLQSFYESLGFKKISDPYPVDEIPHIKMSQNLSIE